MPPDQLANPNPNDITDVEMALLQSAAGEFEAAHGSFPPSLIDRLWVNVALERCIRAAIAANPTDTTARNAAILACTTQFVVMRDS